MAHSSHHRTSGVVLGRARRIMLLVLVAVAATLTTTVPAGAGPDAPEPVRRLEARPADRSLLVSWRAPIDAADHDILGYRIGYRAIIESIAADEAGPSGARVFGGTAIELAQAPWQVPILFTGVEGINAQFCGGSLIHPRWVLTAAHCFDGEGGTTTPAQALQVGDGIVNLDDVRPNQRVDVVNVIVHPGWTSGRGTPVDLALLELRRPLRQVTPIRLDRAPTTPAGLEGWVSGWGHTNADLPGDDDFRPEFPLDLQGASVTIQAGPGEDCGRYPVYDEADHVCASDPGVADTCAGDSGGPLALLRGGQWVLSGVTSFGAGCGRPNYPGIYHRVAPYVRWIHRYVEELAPQTARTSGRAFELDGLTNGLDYRITVTPRTDDGLGAPSTIISTPGR